VERQVALDDERAQHAHALADGDGVVARAPLGRLARRARGRRDPRRVEEHRLERARVERARAPVEVGHASAVLCHAANSLIRLFPEAGPTKAAWSATLGRFVDHEAANRMLVPRRRDP
jgi:hypothetical protein